jgi:hypothetical protein
VIKGFGGKPEKKSLIGRPRRRLEDDFKVDVQEMGWETWTDVARERVRRRAVVNALIEFGVHKIRGIFFWTN